MRFAVTLLALCAVTSADLPEALREPLRWIRNMEDKKGLQELDAVLKTNGRAAFRRVLGPREITTLYWLLERNEASAPVVHELIRRAFPNTPKRLLRHLDRDLDRVLAKNTGEDKLVASYGAAVVSALVSRLQRKSVDQATVVRIASKLGGRAVLPLCAALESPAGSVRVACVRALRTIHGADVLAEHSLAMMDASLKQALDKERSATVKRAIEAARKTLGQNGTDAAGAYLRAAHLYYDRVQPEAEAATDTPWVWRNGLLVPLQAAAHVRHLVLAAQAARAAMRHGPKGSEAPILLVGALADRCMVEQAVASARGTPRTATARALRSVRGELHRLADHFRSSMNAKPDPEITAFLIRETPAMKRFGPNAWTIHVVGAGLSTRDPLTRATAMTALEQLVERTRSNGLALEDQALAMILRGLQYWGDPDARDHVVLLLLSARRTPAQDRRIARTLARAEYATDEELRKEIVELLRAGKPDPERKRLLAQLGAKRWQEAAVREQALRFLFGAKRSLDQDRRLAHHLARESMGGPGENTGPVARIARKPTRPRPTRIRVYYATDRAELFPAARWYLLRFGAAAIAVLAMLCLPAVSRWLLHPRIVRRGRIVKWAGWCLALFLVVQAAYTDLRMRKRITRVGHEYSGDRGQFHDDEAYCHFGWCDIGIPTTHVAGGMERPAPLTGDLWEDPQKHILMLRIQPLERPRFLDELEATVDRAAAKHGRRQAFVFVHGFNVTFEDAALRTAQIAHDLQFQGAPILFSWPSQGGLFNYTMDESSVAWATGHLKLFLRELRTRLPEATIHLIAHSMGNRALTEALRRLGNDMDRGKLRGFQQLVLAAPDIDAATFREDIAPALRRTVERITLYASSNDKALKVSQEVHGYPRAGDSGASVLVIVGVDSIDCSAVETDIIGHSYYGSVGRILDDMLRLLRFRETPKERGLDGPDGGPWKIPAEND